MPFKGEKYFKKCLICSKEYEFENLKKHLAKKHNKKLVRTGSIGGMVRYIMVNKRK